ncbi:uncharacterized protein LOC116430740 [Nomia melanderi]|uniref:uncharacterized protein LOC116430740 n=1 Tax=Nomia melanderi TaxID=2448451 RepID=UPI0013045ECB|nr:prion-like-(Q/N-rich) domain-bearing protein 25 [Nomia melanderi]
MLRARNIVFCFFLALLGYPLNKGSVVSTESQGDDVAVHQGFSNEQKCDGDSDCPIKNSVCINKICQCASGYVINGSLTACIKVVTAYNDDCEESIQCSSYLHSGAACVNKVCTCIDGYYYLHGRCNAYTGLLGKCRLDEDCYVHAEYGAASCDNGVCKCSPGYYQREYRTCRPEGKVVGDACVIDNDCKLDNAYCDDNKCSIKKDKSISVHKENMLQESYELEQIATELRTNCTTNEACGENALCSELGICICKRGYFFDTSTTKCVPELGESCQENDNSTIEYAECKNKKWNCVSGRVSSASNQQCLKLTRVYNNSCLNNENCQIFGPDSICENKKCICNENSHFVESEMFCWLKTGFNGTCQRDIDCYIDGINTSLSCTNKVCSCPEGTHANSDYTDCLENYIGINSSCTMDSECQPNNSVCRKNYCTCKENYTATSFKSCKPLRLFGESCDADVQCSTTVPNAICSAVDTSTTNKVCSCSEDYHYRFNKCNKRKVLGEICLDLGECYLNSNQHRVKCKNGQCACDWDYVKVNDTVCEMHSDTRYNNNGNAINNVSGGLLTTALLMISYLVTLV